MWGSLDRARDADHRYVQIGTWTFLPRPGQETMAMSSTCPLIGFLCPFSSSQSRLGPPDVLRLCVLVLSSSGRSSGLAGSSDGPCPPNFCRRPPLSSVVLWLLGRVLLLSSGRCLSLAMSPEWTCPPNSCRRPRPCVLCCPGPCPLPLPSSGSVAPTLYFTGHVSTRQFLTMAECREFLELYQQRRTPKDLYDKCGNLAGR